ncbi:stringent starvation protein SspA [Kangiella spongicola]|jgi:RNA polymerase-associated protein|uniref:Stringent starvation protein A n=1 Tax=Kangiella spongicola TaxID=796379 RepID=A0A318D2E5_9GAMM|nr:stringent starvation protein SspA [Kangiella spongicola]MBV35557.1 stringent starvation protein A [Rickettsiales bacterium]PXF63320.1 stringent starvation protein A [Kangiella spongicola]
MAVVAKRSVMTLYSGNDVYSHQARIVLAEKGVNYEVVEVTADKVPEDLMDLNPYGSVPTLIDRDLVLYEASIVMEYLDERFPHPPLMPVYPVTRGRSRLMMHRIEKEWYSQYEIIVNGTEAKAKKARKELQESILALSPVFASNPYFMSEEFSLVDCVIAPLLWRAEQLGIEISGRGSKAIHEYMERIFERESFKVSLTEEEREMKLGLI